MAHDAAGVASKRCTDRPLALLRSGRGAALPVAAMVFSALLHGTAAAQSTEGIRALRLGVGYAQILNLATAPELSSANYRFKSSVENRGQEIGVTRLPVQGQVATLGPDAALLARLTAGHVRMEDQLRLGLPPDYVGGRIDSRWGGTGLSAGLAVAVDIGSGWHVVPGVDIGYARLNNKARYSGLVAESRPELDNAVFNWKTGAYLVTPNLGLQWASHSPERSLAARAHVSYSWIRSRGESAPVIAFEEHVGSYSLRLERAAPTSWQLVGRPIDWMVFGGAAGFFGDNRRALGFVTVYELGLGLKAPFRAAEPTGRALRVGVSALNGSDFRGWTFVLGLQH